MSPLFESCICSKSPAHVMMLATAGNLSITQAVINLIVEGFENSGTQEIEQIEEMPSMFRAAQLIGRAVRKVREIDGDALQQASLNFGVSFLFGGQKSGGKLRLFNIYAAGNFIECTIDTRYLQIGEHKYGKPILDRAVYLRHGIV